ncbi:hypothetical protein COU91_02720 [Candidatus Saccharibacteria bacterium CG10_big_fil_rev_8_21_14_0_10_47_8]|nr:MAG: hypothetical protein COU91_02720 [Candidatus Saccharibacteria bacterium CG10_big_fil_rev_8_21_14_0_10_47_8]
MNASVLNGSFEGKPPYEIAGSRYEFFPMLINELEFKKGVEIGTERGIYAKAILRRCPNFKLYCVDPWEAYPGYREHVNQQKLDWLYKQTKKRLKPYNHQLIKGFSSDAHKLFDDGGLDFLYVDGNHEYSHVVADLRHWLPKVRVGGVVAGHDFSDNPGKRDYDVKDVISAYTYAKKINPWFILKEKKEASSWFWVKR